MFLWRKTALFPLMKAFNEDTSVCDGGHSPADSTQKTAVTQSCRMTVGPGSETPPADRWRNTSEGL